jgi:dephospho-CoA kinase
MLIGVVGKNGSGKDSVATYLVKNHGFAYKDLGQEIREELKKRGKNYLDRIEMIKLANEMRSKYGFNYWCKRAIDSVKSKDLVIISLRNPAAVDEIKSRGGVIIEIFADQDIRFRRTVQRVGESSKAHEDVQSFEDFKAKEIIELENTDPAKQQLNKCISMADYRLNNNGSIEQLDMEMEELLGKIA